MFDLNWNIRPTTVCSLGCEYCEITWLKQKFNKTVVKHINITDLINFLKGHNPKVMISNGNGDPLFHPKILKLIYNLKKINATIHFKTAGHKKSKKWWNIFSNLLDKNDQVTFCIDGLENTNHLYKIGSDWKSIMLGANTLIRKKITCNWQLQLLSTNENDIYKIKKISNEMGFNNFTVLKRGWWHENTGSEKFKPISNNSTINRYDSPSFENIEPICSVNGKPKNLLFIDPWGYFYPCFFLGDLRYKSKTFFKNQYNIKDYTIEDLLKKKEILDFFETTKKISTAHTCCKIKCGILKS